MHNLPNYVMHSMVNLLKVDYVVSLRIQAPSFIPCISAIPIPTTIGAIIPNYFASFWDNLEPIEKLVEGHRFRSADAHHATSLSRAAISLEQE